LSPLIQATFDGAGFHGDSLPAIGLFDVLEHIEDDLAFLRLAHTCSIPSGMIYLTVPAHRWLWSGEDADAEHFRRYNLCALRTLLQNAGWQPVFATYFFSFLPFPMLLLRCLPYYLGLGRRSTAESIKSHAVSQHENPLWRSFRPIFNWEKRRCFLGKSIPFGASCLIIGIKR
jgi:hypothetical protein